jgi:hypothetical protein
MLAIEKVRKFKFDQLQNSGLVVSKVVGYWLMAVLRIRIRRIRMFLGLPDPDPLVRGLDPDPSIIKQK